MRLFHSIPRLSQKTLLPSPNIHGDGGTEVEQVGKKLPRNEEKASSLQEKVDR